MGLSVRRRGKKRLLRYLWNNDLKNCPDCGCRMYFPGREAISDLVASEGITRKRVTRKRIASLDHITPKALCKGDPNYPENLRICCLRCNMRKDAGKPSAALIARSIKLSDIAPG